MGLAELVARGEVKPEELIDFALTGISKLNNQINAVVHVLDIQAKNEIKAGLGNGPFKGVPFLIKEMDLHAAGVPMEMGSRLAQGYTLQYDTELMKRFRKAGFVTIGVTAAPEFGFSATTESVFHGPTRNPWNRERMPGGSSGGSAAAVAGGIVPIAHANDGGGSIRIPAACNGLVGFKPTRGRTPSGPDYGELFNGLGIEFALTRSVRDAAALLDFVAGPDPGHYYQVETPQQSYREAIQKPTGRLLIAWSKSLLSETNYPIQEDCLRVLLETVKLCQDLGHELVEETPQVDGEMLNAESCIWAANIVKMVDSIAAAMERSPSPENLEATTWSTYQYGKTIQAVELLRALDVNNRISRAVGCFFKKYDVFLTPTTAQPPLPIGALNANNPDLDTRQWMEQGYAYAPFTSIFNITGQPALSLPLGWNGDNLPIGIQFAGRFSGETTLFRLARQLEQARPWHGMIPPIHLSST